IFFVHWGDLCDRPFLGDHKDRPYEKMDRNFVFPTHIHEFSTARLKSVFVLSEMVGVKEL
ncbi:MAG: hypothetical protein U9N60_03540, partial [Thermodesulfobacteriota bacterium]|nr:hypothetical protein [Thermodesulfobacteriota bacterium]